MTLTPYNRSRYIAFGLLPALNIIVLLLHGLNLATHGRGGAAASLPALVVMAGVCVPFVLLAAARRALDLGWSAWQMLAIFLLSIMLGPALLLLIAYLAIAKSKSVPAAEVAAAPGAGIVGTANTVVWALLNLAWPWVVLAVLAKVL